MQDELAREESRVSVISGSGMGESETRKSVVGELVIRESIIMSE